MWWKGPAAAPTPWWSPTKGAASSGGVPPLGAWVQEWTRTAPHQWRSSCRAAPSAGASSAPLRAGAIPLSWRCPSNLATWGSGRQRWVGECLVGGKRGRGGDGWPLAAGGSLLLSHPRAFSNCSPPTHPPVPDSPLQWDKRKPLYSSPSPPGSTMGRDRSWGGLADDEAEADGGGELPPLPFWPGLKSIWGLCWLGRGCAVPVNCMHRRCCHAGLQGQSQQPPELPCLPVYYSAVSPEGMSDYADEGIVDGPSPGSLSQPHRAFSSQHLQQMEMAAALEGGRSSDNLSEGGQDPSPAQAAAAAAAARVHGLRDDTPPQ